MSTIHAGVLTMAAQQLAWSLWLWLAAAGAATTDSRVSLAPSDWHLSTVDRADADDLRAALLAWHEAWVARDAKACAALLSVDAVRAVQSQGDPEVGRRGVLAALPREWAALEQDDSGGSALTVVLRDVRVQIAGDAALLRYYTEVSGGTRWEFEDLIAFSALWRREADGEWRQAFQADAANLDVDIDSGAPGRANFSYDYALPVQDLARAVRFYTLLLGSPEAVEAGIAVFQLNGSRLYLDSTGQAPGATPIAGLPNGWPLVYAADPARARQRARAAGVEFVGGEQSFAGQRVRYAFDPAGNLLALASAVPAPARAVAELEVAAPVAGKNVPQAIIDSHAVFARAWLDGDIDRVAEQLDTGVALLDAARTRTRGWLTKAAAVRQGLVASMPTPESPDGQASALRLAPPVTLRVGPWLAWSGRRTLVGAAPWQRQAHALQSLVFDARSAKIVQLVNAATPRVSALALDFDYAGLPATAEQWDEAAHALRAFTGARDSYQDEGWLGLWGERAVLGLFEAEVDSDGLPRDHAASAYLSLWVSDVNAALRFARAAGADLPVVPAINDRAGIDRNPGYQQVYLSDSEGNGIVLTEYTGRRNR